jgi:aspartate kinase
VARLTLALHALGVRASAANVHQTGIVADEASGESGFRPLRLLAALDASDVVVAPGFLARSGGDGVASLGRGGADLSAVLLAVGLRARRCELVKDVAGYFSADPNRAAGATHVPALSWTDALRAADRGCALVQRQALEAARTHALPVVVRALGSDRRATVVGDLPAPDLSASCGCTA